MHASPIVDIFIQQLINGLVLGSMYALVALGYTMVYGIVNLINFAHGEVLMVGALVSWTVVTLLGDTGWPGWVLLTLSLLAAMAVCMALNYAIEKLAYRPLRNAPRLAPLITAMGMSLLLQTLAMILWKPDYKPYPILLNDEPYEFMGATINLVQILILVVTALTMAGLLALIHGTKLGRAMRATAENPRVAQLMGVQPDKVISATFIIGAALAALAGVMWAANYGSVRHRQPGWCHGGRSAAGRHRGHGRRLHRRADRRRAGQPLPGHLRLHGADPGADLASTWPAGRTCGRPGVRGEPC